LSQILGKLVIVLKIRIYFLKNIIKLYQRNIW